MIDGKFNDSALKDEKLRLAREHRERLIKIERIADLTKREQLFGQIKENERQVREAESKAKQLEEKAVHESIKQNIAPKLGLHLKPRYGSPLPPRRQESQIRKNIRRSVGAKLDRQQAQLLSSLNRNLDNAISQAHSTPPSRENEKEMTFSENANDITKTATQRSHERQETRARTRETGRSRIRRR